MVHYTVEAIIEGIRSSDNNVLQFVYRKHYPKIKFFVLKNCGTDDEAKDIFQDAIIIIYKKIRDGSLVLDCSFRTYLYSVCKFLWLKQLKKKNKSLETNSEGLDLIEIDDDLENLYNENERYKLYQHHFEMLNKDCQKVLKLFLKKVPLKEIAMEMGYSSEKYAKKRKYQCKEILVKSIQNDTKYNNIKLSDEK